MSKIGVGVGDDFPLDDGNGGGPNRGQGGDGPQDSQDDRTEFEEWKRRRDARRAEREAWERQRAEWRARKRAFKERVRRAAYESFGNGDGWHGGGDGRYRWRPHFWPFGMFGMAMALFAFMIPVFLIVLFFSLISAAFKAPFVLIAIVALGIAFMAWRHHHWRHRWYRHAYGAWGPCDYDLDLSPRESDRGQSPPPRNPPPPNGGTIVTPPPSAGK